MLLTPGLWFRKKCYSLNVRIFRFNFCTVCELFVCFFFFFFSDDFYFHLSLIERKIMHTFISFRFQSHTFQEEWKKNRNSFFFFNISDIFLCLKTHLCASEIFSSIATFLSHILLRKIQRKIKEMSIFGCLVRNLHRISIYPIFKRANRRSNQIYNKLIFRIRKHISEIVWDHTEYLWLFFCCFHIKILCL